jgi:hypothetical protein
MQSGVIRVLVLVAVVNMIRYLWARVSKMWLLGTGGIGDSFILLPKILWCWESFARAFLLGSSLVAMLVIWTMDDGNGLLIFQFFVDTFFEIGSPDPD